MTRHCPRCSRPLSKAPGQTWLCHGCLSRFSIAGRPLIDGASNSLAKDIGLRCPIALKEFASLPAQDRAQVLAALNDPTVT